MHFLKNVTDFLQSIEDKIDANFDTESDDYSREKVDGSEDEISDQNDESHVKTEISDLDDKNAHNSGAVENTKKSGGRSYFDIISNKAGEWESKIGLTNSVKNFLGYVSKENENIDGSSEEKPEKDEEDVNVAWDEINMDGLTTDSLEEELHNAQEGHNNEENGKQLSVKDKSGAAEPELIAAKAEISEENSDQLSIKDKSIGVESESSMIKVEDNEENSELRHRIENINRRIKDMDEEKVVILEEISKYERILKNIGPKGDAVLNEFEQRKGSYENTLKKLTEEEESLKTEISSNKDIEVSLQNVQKNKFDITEHLNVLTDQLKMINNENDEITKKISNMSDLTEQLDVSAGRLYEIIFESGNKSVELEEEIKIVEERIIHIKTQNEPINKEFSAVDSDMKELNEQRREFNDKFRALNLKKSNLLTDLAEKETVITNRVNEIKKQKITKMKNLTSDKLNAFELEKKSLISQKEQIQKSIQDNKEKFDATLREIESHMNSERVKEEELNLRLNDVNNNIPQLMKPLNSRLENLKAIYETNRQTASETLQRIKKDIHATDNENENISSQCESLQQNIASVNSHKQELDKENKRLIEMHQRIDSEISDLQGQCESINRRKTYTSAKLKEIQSELSRSDIELKNKEEQLMSLKNKKELQRQSLMSALERMEAVLRRSSTVCLTEQVSKLRTVLNELESEERRILKFLEETKDIQNKYSEISTDIEDKKNNIKQLKKFMERQRQHHKKKISELLN